MILWDGYTEIHKYLYPRDMLPSLKNTEQPPTAEYLCDFCSTIQDKKIQTLMLVKRLTREVSQWDERTVQL
jgi:hypothetical protein